MHCTVQLQVPKPFFRLYKYISLPFLPLQHSLCRFDHDSTVMMKRQREMAKIPKSRDGESHPEVLKYEARKRRKRVKEEEEEEEEEVGVKEEKGVGRESMAVELQSVLAWEEEPWVASGVVDELMSWGLLWYPGWDMELMGEAYNQLYSDVVWEDDVWNLKSITEIPNP